MLLGMTKLNKGCDGSSDKQSNHIIGENLLIHREGSISKDFINDADTKSRRTPLSPRKTEQRLSNKGNHREIRVYSLETKLQSKYFENGCQITDSTDYDKTDPILRGKIKSVIKYEHAKILHNSSALDLFQSECNKIFNTKFCPSDYKFAPNDVTVPKKVCHSVNEICAPAKSANMATPNDFVSAERQCALGRVEGLPLFREQLSDKRRTRVSSYPRQAVLITAANSFGYSTKSALSVAKNSSTRRKKTNRVSFQLESAAQTPGKVIARRKTVDSAYVPRIAMPIANPIPGQLMRFKLPIVKAVKLSNDKILRANARLKKCEISLVHIDAAPQTSTKTDNIAQGTSFDVTDERIKTAEYQPFVKLTGK